jgi:hypothetical protein
MTMVFVVGQRQPQDELITTVSAFALRALPKETTPTTANAATKDFTFLI